MQVDAGQLLDLATQRELLSSVIGDKGQRSQRIRLGRASVRPATGASASCACA